MVFWIFQAEPSQPAASVRNEKRTLGLCRSPTAVQIVAVTHETWKRAPAVNGAEVAGTVLVVHFDPLKTSASGLVPRWPTAAQNVVAGQDTLKSADLGTAGTRIIVQPAPEKRSANALRPGLTASPTAMQLAGPEHETPSKVVVVLPATVLAAWTCHTPPVHSAEYGRDRPRALV